MSTDTEPRKSFQEIQIEQLMTENDMRAVTPQQLADRATFAELVGEDPRSYKRAVEHRAEREATPPRPMFPGLFRTLAEAFKEGPDKPPETSPMETYVDDQGVERCDNCSQDVNECACCCVVCGDYVSECACQDGPTYPAVSDC